MKEKLQKLYTVCYDGCYAIGVLFLRSFLRSFETVKRFFNKIFRAIGHTAVYAVWNTYQGFKFLFGEISVPIKAFVNFAKHFKKMYKHSLETGGKELAIENTKHLIKNNRRQINKHLRVFSSYALPVLSLVLLLVCVNIFDNRMYAVSVSLNGQHIGYIADEGVYSDAEKLMQERIVYADGEQPYFVSKDLEVKSVSTSTTIDDAYTLCNSLIYAVTEDIKEAYGLYVDGVFEGAVQEGHQLQSVLKEILREHEMGIEGETTEFTVDVQIKEGLYPQSAVIPFSEMYTKLYSEVAGERTYTVVEGDAPIIIAKKNDITLSQLRALNPEIDKYCFIGDVVLISKSVPFLTVQTKVTESYEVEVPYKLVSTNSNKYAYGTTTVLKAGKAGRAIETSEKIYVNGVLQSTDVVDTQIIEPAVNREVIVGTYIDVSGSKYGSGKYSGSFMWPVDGGYVSCHINGYRGHTGMDIAAPKGTNIRASMAGRVIKVKKQTYNYGYHVMIDHGNGVQTLYAHCSKLLVSVGEYVEQGEVIALVGSTGNSTGNHCHFEIRINGQYKNPANYVGSSYK